MAQLTINIGTNANDGTGDPLRTAFDKINANFAELYGDDSTANTFSSPQILSPTITGTATIDNMLFNDSEISTPSNAKLHLNPGGTGTIELEANTNVTGALDVTGAVTLDTSLTLASGATITAFSTSTALGTSDTVVPTQNAVKTYIDAQNTAQAITFVGDDSTGTAVNNGETFQILGGTGLTSAVSGDVMTLNIDGTVATLTGSQTLTNKIIQSATIDSGTINNANIGFTTPALGFFTTVDAREIYTTNASGESGILIKDNTITTNSSNANLQLSGNGSGSVEILDNLTGNFNIANTGTINTTGSITATSNITAQGTVFTDKIQSPATNADLNILAQGTGVVNVQSPMTTVAQTISGNVTVPEGFITQLGFLQVFSNTISSVTNGDINIATSGAGQIVLSAPRVAAGQINASTFVTNGNVDTNSIRSFDSNADISIESQGTGQIAMNSAVKFNVGYIDDINTLTSSSTITVNCQLAPVHKVTLGTNTGFVVTNLPTGGTVTLIIRQDATGFRTATFGTDGSTAIKFPSGAATLSTAANSIDVVTIFNDGVAYLGNIANSYS
jgi:hypothetical protein